MLEALNCSRMGICSFECVCTDLTLMNNIMACRHLEKQAAEEKEKERQERRRKERKNRDAFMELLQRHLSEGVIVARMRWKVLQMCLLQTAQGSGWADEPAQLLPYKTVSCNGG